MTQYRTPEDALAEQAEAAERARASMRYILVDQSERLEDAHVVPNRYGGQLCHDRFAAELAAEDYYQRRNGREVEWPVNIELIDRHGCSSYWSVMPEEAVAFRAVRQYPTTLT